MLKLNLNLAHTVVLGAIAQATKHIKVSSYSTIISATDPVRVFEDFATLDLISHGSAEIVAGRASRTGVLKLNFVIKNLKAM